MNKFSTLNLVPNPKQLFELVKTPTIKLKSITRILAFNALFKDKQDILSGSNTSGSDKIYYQYPNKN